MKRKKSLGFNGLLNGVRSALNLVFPLITFPYITRVLSVGSVGAYNFSNTYVGYFILLAGLGISTYAVREGAKYRDNRERLSKFASEIFAINLWSTVVSYVLLFMSLLIFRNLQTYLLFILIFSVQIFFTTVGIEWIYIINEDYSYITARSIIFKIISIVMLFLLVKSRNDYLWYAGITVFSSVGSNVLNYINANKICDIRLTTNINWKKHLKPIFIIFASTLAVNIYLSSDTTILGIMKSDYDVGIYSITVKIYNIVATLLGSVMTVTVPRLSMLMGQGKMKEYKETFIRVINVLALLVIPGTIGLMMLSQEIVLLIAGPKYLESTNALRIIGLAVIFSNFSFVFYNCVLIPAKREKQGLFNTIAAAIVNVLLNICLIPMFAYDGTSFSTVVAEIMTTVMNFWAGKDIIKSTVFSKRVIHNLFTVLIASIFVAISCWICKLIFASLLLRIGASVISSGIVYFVALVLLKNELVVSKLKR